MHATQKAEATARRYLATIAATFALTTLLPSMAAGQNVEAPFADVTAPDEIRSAIDTLNDYLVPLSPEVAVAACQLLIGRHPGRIETIYAGACQLKSGAHAFVCGDTGVGEFGLTLWRPRRRGSENWVGIRVLLERLARANCPGG